MSDRLVHIATFFDQFEAQVAQGRLAAEGIQSHLDGEMTASMAWQLTSAIGGLKLFVMDEDSDAAVDLLETIAQRHDERIAEEEGGEHPDDDPDDEADGDRNAHPTHQRGIITEVDAEPVNAREEMADRAARSTLFSLLFPPLFFYSAYLLFCIFIGDEPLSRRGQVKTLIAAAINIALWVGFVIVLKTGP